MAISKFLTIISLVLIFGACSQKTQEAASSTANKVRNKEDLYRTLIYKPHTSLRCVTEIGFWGQKMIFSLRRKDHFLSPNPIVPLPQGSDIVRLQKCTEEKK